MRGDSSAYQPLVERYRHLVYTTVVKIVRDEHTARDVAQEAFWQAYRSLNNFRGEAAFSSWLVRIAVNKALDFTRRQRRSRELPLEQSVELADCPAPGPEEQVVEREMAAELLEHVERLPEIYRQVVRQHFIHYLSYKEIARREGVSVKTVASRIHRAKTMLRRMVGGREEV